MKTVEPLTRERLGGGWVLRVKRNLVEPFNIGDLVMDGSSRYRVLQIEGTPQPHLVDLIVERAV